MYTKVRCFLSDHYKNLDTKAQFDYCFYGYYFLDAVSYIDRRLESYFHPNSRRNPNFMQKKFIPTHVSEAYFNSLRTSKLFVRDFVIVLKQCLPGEAAHNIVSWLSKTCTDWETWVESHGWDDFFEHAAKKFKKSSKAKFPWGLQEVKNATKNILFKLGHV